MHETGNSMYLMFIDCHVGSFGLGEDVHNKTTIGCNVPTKGVTLSSPELVNAQAWFPTLGKTQRRMLPNKNAFVGQDTAVSQEG